MPAVLLSSTSQALYDRGYKTLGVVLKSVRSSLLHPKLNHSGGKSRKTRGKSRRKAKQKKAPPLKGYRSLLLPMAVTSVFCILGSGEAVWFSHDSEAAEGGVEGVSIEVC